MTGETGKLNRSTMKEVHLQGPSLPMRVVKMQVRYV